MKEKKTSNRKGGWQVWVDFYPKHVIKTIRTKKEMRARISPYLKSTGKMNELKIRIAKLNKDIKNSIKIIKKNKVPIDLIGHAIFLKNGQIKQKRVVSLEDYLTELSKNNKIKDAEKIIDKAIRTIFELWQYGIHEKTFKFNQNFGIDKSRIILIDFLEITDKKTKVIKQLRKKPWKKIKKFEKNISSKILDYWIKQANKKLTIRNLNKYWERKV